MHRHAGCRLTLPAGEVYLPTAMECPGFQNLKRPTLIHIADFAGGNADDTNPDARRRWLGRRDFYRRPQSRRGRRSVWRYRSKVAPGTLALDDEGGREVELRCLSAQTQTEGAPSVPETKTCCRELAQPAVPPCSLLVFRKTFSETLCFAPGVTGVLIPPRARRLGDGQRRAQATRPSPPAASTGRRRA